MNADEIAASRAAATALMHVPGESLNWGPDGASR